MNILLIAPTDPASENSGAEQRTAALHRALSTLGTVYTLLPVKRPGRTFLDARHRLQGICFLPPNLWGKRLLRSLFKRIFPHLHLPLVDPAVTGRVFPGVRFDCVVVRYLHVAAETLAWRFGPCFVDVDDLPSEHYETGPAKRHGALRRAVTNRLFRRWTAWVGRHLAGVWVTSGRHRNIFPHLPTALLPNIARPMPADFPFDAPRAPRLLTVGLMSYAPNHEGVDRFLTEVWPALRTVCPNLTYRIVGRGVPEGCRKRWSATPGVEIAGFVEDLDAEYAQALACVAPIDSGSGTCIKTIEALLHGRCCLATPFAARGWPDEVFDGTNGLAVYRTPKECLSYFQTLIQPPDARQAAERAGHAYATAHFGFDGFMDNVRRALLPPPSAEPPISVSCASDHAYFCGLWVTLHSLCTHCAEGCALRLHILDGGLTAEDRAALSTLAGRFPGKTIDVRLHPIDPSDFSSLPKWRGNHVAYARLMLQDLLPDEDYTLYTDVDTLWLRDVSELWALRDDTPCKAVPDGSCLPLYSSGEAKTKVFRSLGVEIRPENYFCSGLLLMNLRALRDMGFTQRWMHLLSDKPSALSFPDQDLYNLILPYPLTKPLDWRWGEFSATYGLRPIDGPRVIHYANAAPWTHKASAVAMLWWDWLAHHAGFEPLNVQAKALRRRWKGIRFKDWVIHSPIGSLYNRFLAWRKPSAYAKRLVRHFPERCHIINPTNEGLRSDPLHRLFWRLIANGFPRRSRLGRIVRARRCKAQPSDAIFVREIGRIQHLFHDFAPDTDVLALGTSHIRNTICPIPEAPLRLWNAGFDNSDLFIAHGVYQALRARWPKAPGQIVLLGDDFWLASHQAEYTQYFWTSVILHLVAGLPLRSHLLLGPTVRRITPLIAVRQPIPDRQGYTPCTEVNIPCNIKWIRGHVRRAFYPPTEFVWLERLRAAVEADGRRLVLIRPPLRADYRAELAKQAAGRDVYAPGAKAREGLTILDYTEAPIPENGWYDADHLNNLGAAWLTPRLIADLQKLPPAP